MNFRSQVKVYIKKVKKLQGDPHYVAMGMAVGVFVAITPTIPLHTVIAIALAIVLKCSKPAAALGVWFSNPLTIPPLYYASLKAGKLIYGDLIPLEMQYESVTDLLHMGWKAAVVMLTGGVVLGIVPGIMAYYITLKIFKSIRARRVRSKQEKWFNE
ncbi:MAG: DUF2062 domain-containing protein [Desulfobacterales bacterium]|nr:DUF2062 domain-containing protein [Desulfobacterales bacterium]